MHDPRLPAGCTQADIDARFEPEEPTWVASYVTQLQHRLDRLEMIRMELAADCFDGAYDGADILGYLDDEMETVRMEIGRPQLMGRD
ncbi:hypothetical protein LU298_03915 [Komagataeibacter intermedius]|uniref:Uncharacterized protein n=2 Tax=Komagataeibacter intermedius TaxID=66229 RepID=A0A0N0MG38_9PROT|nr:hypothetical protein [Komagataeibacter intermedius]KPH88306.1 hypothetical protein GLUCOINTEAF2_0201721 [Komagataeibacter intermedius AF2]MCF3635647.1 hypothetical protein [Komagataeibacter intermedius]GAN87716.1 hypothetical protein Gain_0077_056 [Komagataeibacter intermedius TF2]GBQ75563.1 hypothetical protein AA0521_2699 [Komagataeibacter intermedius NRIC 0521]